MIEPIVELILEMVPKASTEFTGNNDAMELTQQSYQEGITALMQELVQEYAFQVSRVESQLSRIRQMMLSGKRQMIMMMQKLVNSLDRNDRQVRMYCGMIHSRGRQYLRIYKELVREVSDCSEYS